MTFAYNEQAHRSDTVAKLACHYLYIIEQIIQTSTQVTAYHETRLQDIGILTAEEREQIRHFNLTTASYPREKTIHELFEEQVRLAPEGTAVTDEQRSCTYREAQ